MEATNLPINSPENLPEILTRNFTSDWSSDNLKATFRVKNTDLFLWRKKGVKLFI